MPTSGRKAAPGLTDPPLWAVTLTVMLGMLMAIIDTSIVNVALPTMSGNLGATTDEIAWVATGYILANVIVMPLNGWLTARFGRKRYYATCLIVFTLASLLCGTSRSTIELVIWRIVQGLGGGALQPTAQSILFESFPPDRRSQAMSIFGLGAMVGPAIGPTMGGYIVDNFSWPLIFFINIPIGIVACFMTLAFIRDPAYLHKPERSIDTSALLMMVIGLAAMQYVLERGQREDWFSSNSIIILTALAIIFLVAFIIREWRDPHAMVRLRIFRQPAFAAGNIIGVVSGFGLYGLNLVLPEFMQRVLGFSATFTGIALVPGALATAVSMVFAPKVGTLLGPRGSIIGGLLLFAAGAWWMGSLDQTAGYDQLLWPRVLQGLALGFLFVPLTTMTLAGIDRSELPGATGIYTLVRQLGGSLGIAILELLEIRQEAIARSSFVNDITLRHTTISGMLGTQGAHNIPALIRLQQLVEQNSAVVGYDYIFRLSAILFLAAIPLVLLLKPRPDATDALSTMAPE